MKKEDLLSLLQDIVEQDGWLLYLKIHYIDERSIDIGNIQKIIIHGLKNNILEVFEHIDSNGKTEYKDLSVKDAILAINDNKAWIAWPVIYEVTFIDIPKYIGILFNINGPKIPNEFIQFIKE
jgi:hypothetical protein